MPARAVDGASALIITPMPGTGTSFATGALELAKAAARRRFSRCVPSLSPVSDAYADECVLGTPPADPCLDLEQDCIFGMDELDASGRRSAPARWDVDSRGLRGRLGSASADIDPFSPVSFSMMRSRLPQDSDLPAAPLNPQPNPGPLPLPLSPLPSAVARSNPIPIPRKRVATHDSNYS